MQSYKQPLKYQNTMIKNPIPTLKLDTEKMHF